MPLPLPPGSRPSNVSGSAPPPINVPFKGQVFGGKSPGDAGDIYSTWQKDKTPENTSLLLDHLKPTIRSSVRKYAGDDDPVAMGRAKQLVIGSLDRYDPEKASLPTYVDRQLQPLMRWQSRRRRTVRTPDRVQMEMMRLLDAEKELRDETGREPSASQLADYTGFPMRKITALRQANVREVTGSTQLNTESGQEDVSDLAIYNDAAASEAWARFVRSDMNSIDQKIFDHTAGFAGAEVLSNQELARRLKISPGAVSQRKLRIQQMLDRESQLSPFG